MYPGREAISTRLVIVGNSGSGKSTLAERIAARTSQPVFDLDPIHWRSDGRKRDESAARELVSAIAAGHPHWIVEGVYGWLADIALPQATALIWTDLPWSDCRDGLLRRGLRRGMTDADLSALLSWAEAYWTRATPSSATGHEKLFESFAGEKARLSTRSEVAALLATFAET